MNEDLYKGYREPCRGVLERFGIRVWCEVRAVTSRGSFEGLLLPRSETVLLSCDLPFFLISTAQLVAGPVARMLYPPAKALFPPAGREIVPEPR